MIAEIPCPDTVSDKPRSSPICAHRVGIEFTREQLLDPEYDPITRGEVDLEDLRARYEGRVAIRHAAAIRGILVKDEPDTWIWIWGVGLLHDEMVRTLGYPRLYARFCNQYLLLPRIEFEDGADVRAALRLLLAGTPIERDDLVNIESPYRSTRSISDYLAGSLDSRRTNRVRTLGITWRRFLHPHS